MAFDILRLPAELIDCIVDHVDDPRTLHALATSCRQLRPLAETVLYRDVFFRTGTEVANLLCALRTAPHRAKAVQSIDARFHWRRHEGINKLDSILQLCRNVKDLTIESPFCNSGRWRDASGWRQTMEELLQPLHEASTLPTATTTESKPLSNLSKLTLHLNGDKTEFWAVAGAYASVFAHPTLIDLTLSSANIDERATDVLRGSKTPLRRLTLDECNISQQGLSGILAVPQALEYLYFGENHYSSEGKFQSSGEKSFNLCNTNPHGFMAALSQQQNSLQTLHYWVKDDDYLTPPLQVPMPNSALGFSGFAALKNVTIEGACPFLRLCLGIQSAAPPALNDLAITSSTEMVSLDDAEADFERIRHREPNSLSWLSLLPSALPHLSRLSFVFAQLEFSETIEAAEVAAMAAMVQAMKAKGVRLELLEAPGEKSFVRPILYGETPYTNHLIYDPDRECLVGDLANSANRGNNDAGDNSSSEWESEGASEETDDLG